MSSDQQVTSRIILQSLLELRRQVATTAPLELLEQVEPDLACYVMETLSDLHRRLERLGAPLKRTRRIYREVELLVLACITALRNGHYELCRQTSGPVDECDDSTAPKDA